MKLMFLLVSFLLLSTIQCDLFDEQFYEYLVDNIFLTTGRTLEPLILIRSKTIISNAAYEANVPYTEKSVSIYSMIPRRPVNERTTRNKNIAIAYAVLRCSESVLPSTVPQLVTLYTSLGLDTNDKSYNLSSPIGIGNYAAKKILEGRENDGMNQLGNENGKKYNLKPYEDYTNYVPKNSAFKLDFAGNWQPNVDQIAFGVYIIQQHMCAQYGRVKPYCLKNINKYTCPTPAKSNPSKEKNYKDQADEVLDESRKLDDYKKMIAEHFDNKVVALSSLLFFFQNKYNLTQDEFIALDFFSHMAIFDGGLVTWKEKIKHDAVRPFSAIRYLYENKNIEAWGGPGKGTVNDLKGKEWRSYIRTAPHTEYPSATACFCAAMLTFFKNYFNTTEFGYSILKEKGSSVIEPDITPSTNITLGPFVTFNDYIDACGDARLFGGVHFKSSIDEGKKLCKPIGDAVYDFGIKYIEGTVKPRKD